VTDQHRFADGKQTRFAEGQTLGQPSWLGGLGCSWPASLGAERADVLKLFLRRGIVLASAGIAADVVFSASIASINGEPALRRPPHDPAVFPIVPLLLLAVAGAEARKLTAFETLC